MMYEAKIARVHGDGAFDHWFALLIDLPENTAWDLYRGQPSELVARVVVAMLQEREPDRFSGKVREIEEMTNGYQVESIPGIYVRATIADVTNALDGPKALR